MPLEDYITIEICHRILCGIGKHLIQCQFKKNKSKANSYIKIQYNPIFMAVEGVWVHVYLFTRTYSRKDFNVEAYKENTHSHLGKCNQQSLPFNTLVEPALMEDVVQKFILHTYTSLISFL